MTPLETTARERIDRYRAREWALQIHYRWESGAREDSFRDALSQTLSMRHISPRRLPYLRRVLNALDEHLAEIDRALQDALENWHLSRLSSIDRGILRLAATELLYLDDIPPKVSIQEGIRLAELYGGQDSPRFVNGVLDALYKHHIGKRA
jgi:transcription antitermination protein NusB